MANPLDGARRAMLADEMTTVLLIRHADPVPSRTGDLPEVDDDRGLTSDGHTAAIALSERLADEMSIGAIYSSPFRRAIETVTPLAKRLDIAVTPLEELRERWLSDRVLEYDAFLATYRKTWDAAEFSPPGGESRLSTQTRALEALDHIREKHPGEVVVAATHGGLIGCLLRALDEEMQFEEAMQTPMPAVFAIRHDAGAWSRAVAER